MDPGRTSPSGRPFAAFVVATSFALGSLVALWNVAGTGHLWPDSPRYAMAGAMLHDFEASGRWHQPLDFARDHYAHYPAFNIPYHPPGYPLALSIWFWVFGISVVSARVFVAVFWVTAGLLYYAVNRELRLNRTAAFYGNVVFLLTPQLAVWSRDSLSEVPSLVPMFAAVLFWLRWLRTGRWWDLAGAFAFAEAAFFFRVSTAAMLPALALFGFIVRGYTKKKLLVAFAGAAVYLVLNVLWVKFAASYASFEVAADGKGQPSFEKFSKYLRDCLPGIVAGGTALLAAVGAIVGGFVPANRRAW